MNRREFLAAVAGVALVPGIITEINITRPALIEVLPQGLTGVFRVIDRIAVSWPSLRQPASLALSAADHIIAVMAFNPQTGDDTILWDIPPLILRPQDRLTVQTIPAALQPPEIVAWVSEMAA